MAGLSGEQTISTVAGDLRDFEREELCGRPDACARRVIYALWRLLAS
jgi:hypothetical protein